MKLELKHIAPYLPYGLECQYKSMLGDKVKTGKIISIGSDTLSFEWRQHWEITSVKPLLLPISCLIEEIEHNGERFVPAIEIAKLVDNGHSHSASSVISSTGSNYIKIRTGAVDDVEDVQVSFRDGRIQSVERSGVKVMYQTVVRIQDMLASMHIDFQGLIPAGLAVDKREVDNG